MTVVTFSGQNGTVTKEINAFLNDAQAQPPGLKFVMHQMNTCYTENGCMLVTLLFSYEEAPRKGVFVGE